ncbi:hypothetical protein MBLNU230_g5956t1 [Neophaeotheca triangularis]
MPSTTYTVSSGSGRVYVLPGKESNSASSASVHSPTESEDQSFSSSAGSDGWTDVGFDDGIRPSDSASHSRHPPSRRHTTEARPAPTRRHSSRRVDRKPEEVPQGRSSHRHHTTHHKRRESQRTPSDESTSTVASQDDYPPYGHHGMPQSRQYPPHPPSGYRHVQQVHGGYPPSMASAPAYPDPYSTQALVPTQHHDPFGYPSSNPFTPPVHGMGMHGQQPNPFSPMSTAGQSSYFQGDPHMPNHMGPPARPPGPPRPQSFAAPSQFGGHELTSPYPHPGMYPGMQPGMQQGMPPGMPQGMPYHGYPVQGMMPYQPINYPYTPSQTASPAPAPPTKKEEEAAEKSKKEVEELRAMLKEQEEKSAEKSKGEIEALKEMLKKQEEERLAREQVWIAKAEAEAAAVAAAKAKEEENKRRAAELTAASQKAREEAEKEAGEKAAKAEAEHQKKLEEAKKAQEAVEKKRKELEEEVKKNKPTPDSLKAPIKFKDAVGRKFSFPWHLCKTWKGMEGLIKQAFLHVDVIGLHVQDGHYDLCGPDGEIILPQVWDTMIQPDWEITMHMWPMPEPEPAPDKNDKLAQDAAILADPFGGLNLGNDPIFGADGKVKKPKKDKKNKKAASPEQVPDFSGILPPPPMAGAFDLPDPLQGVFPPVVQAVHEEKKRPKASKSKSTKAPPPLAAWLAGGQRRKRS